MLYHLDLGDDEPPIAYRSGLLAIAHALLASVLLGKRVIVWVGR